MCMDLPDYTRKVIIEYTGGFIGLEELATRLGFIAPFNLQGNLVMMEDFETEETEWDLTDVGVACTSTRVSRRKWSGNWSIEHVIAAAIGRHASIHRVIHFPGVVKYGLFGRFCWTDDFQNNQFGVEFDDGTYRYNVGMGYNLVTTSVGYLDDTGNITVIDATLDLGYAGYVWYPFMLTFDLNTLLYDKLWIADREYDISGAIVRRRGFVTPQRATISHGGVTLAAAGFTMYADDIVLVKNVP